MSRLKSGVSLSLTLGDVVNEKALGLTSVVAGDPHGIVLAARTSELGDPGRWVEPRTIMLTTGLLFIGHERDDAQALALITDMRAAQTTAMFFGVGVHFEEVPTALVAAARSEKFPLYTVAADVPFYAIENFVNQSKLSADAYLLKRAAWFMNELLQSMSADQPIDALIAKLASSCRGSAVLYEDSGRVVASAGEGPIRLMWTEMQRSGGAQERFTVGRWDAIGKSLILRGKTYRLVLASRNSTMLNDLGDVHYRKFNNSGLIAWVIATVTGIIMLQLGLLNPDLAGVGATWGPILTAVVASAVYALLWNTTTAKSALVTTVA